MTTAMKTPGVYIQELDAFGNSVVPVPTAVPVFIGYTEKTKFNGKDLLNKAVKITSLAEFLSIYGDTAPQVQYSLASHMEVSEVAALMKNVTDTAAAETAAKGKVVAPAKATPEQQADIDAATAAAAAATKALTDAKKNALVAAYVTAVEALPATGAPTSAQTDAVTAAEKALTDAAANKNFEYEGDAYELKRTTVNYRMYSGLKFFYENGGGDCFIMTIGAYDYKKSTLSVTTPFTDAITLLEKETEPTMLVIPDAVEFDAGPGSADLETRFAGAYALQQAMINHCGSQMNRVAVLDVPGGFEEFITEDPSRIEQFRTSVTPTLPKYNSYAAAYYPWLHTTVYQSNEVSHKNLTTGSYAGVAAMLTAEFTDKKGVLNPKMESTIKVFQSATPSADDLEQANQVLGNLSKSYKLMMSAIQDEMNLMAPSSGMAGIYTTVDNAEGVWVAPANVGIQSTIAPSIKIDNAAQEDLNVPISGKAICAIRAFTGRGNLVWGARTLDGNSNDWRYVNVRRTLIFLEQSVKDAAKAYVFAPNDASTWVVVQSMISNFLTGIWKQGGLVGPKAADAFSVSVGLGSTMTGDDILNGIMRVSVKVAVSRPAEFIEITFQQEMQKG